MFKLLIFSLIGAIFFCVLLITLLVVVFPNSLIKLKAFLALFIIGFASL